MLLDTNIVLDYLANRMPFAEDAEALFEAAHKKTLALWISSLSFTTIRYLLCREVGQAAARRIVQKLRPLVGVAAVDEACIDRAIASPITDFEDAVQQECALQAGVDVLVTRDLSGFKKASLSVELPSALARAF